MHSKISPGTVLPEFDHIFPHQEGNFEGFTIVLVSVVSVFFR